MDSLAEYIVSVDERNHKVRLLRINNNNTALIELDGKAFEVTFLRARAYGQTSISIDGKSHKIKFNRNDRPFYFNVNVDGKQFVLRIEAKRKELSSKAAISVIPPLHVPKREKIVAKKEASVVSLMPGKVVLLKVKPGDKVKAGDPLCVLEAMKMENEVIAPKEGIVTQVRVEKGSIVNKGDVLVVIE